MATNLIRIQLDGADRWGVVTASGSARGRLCNHGGADRAGGGRLARRIRAAGRDFTGFGGRSSPVTAPCRIYCQGANYRQHMIESGIDPDEKSFNMFFTKSDASLASARAAVRPPAHVKLLDYEIELALIFKRSVSSEFG